MTVAAASLMLPVAAATTSTTVPAADHQPQIPAAAAAMAERLFPSGSPVVVLISGSREGQALAPVAAALAQREQGALLVADNPSMLGSNTTQALAQMSIPQVAPSGNVQPFQPQPGKPSIFLVGDDGVIATSLQLQLVREGYSVTRIGGNVQEVAARIEQIVAPALPSPGGGFATSWTGYAQNSFHNSITKTPAWAPPWERTGVSWNFAEDAAIPFNQGFADTANLGLRGAPVKMTQTLGNAVGVSAVNGIIYSESDDGHIYAIDAKTGKQLWQTGMLANTPMGNPIVANGVLYATVGDTGFPFSQLLGYFLSGGTAQLVRGLGYSAVYAFNATTGRELWRADFKGNAMPTPAYYNGNLYVPTGGGNLWNFDAATGAVNWKVALGGFDSMSSPSVYVNQATGAAEVVVGTSDTNHLVAVNAATGAINWTQPTSLNIFNTGMGDNSPTIDAKNGIIVQDSVVDFNPATKTCNLAVYAMSATTGQVFWSTLLGSGQAPPAYKAGVAMIHNGVVYVGSPVTSTIYAIQEATGQILWKLPLPGSGPAGAGRGAPTYAYGILWAAEGANLYAIDPQTGAILGTFSPGGRFGIVNPVIVGGTMYLDNSYDWVQAVPLSKIYPAVTVGA